MSRNRLAFRTLYSFVIRPQRGLSFKACAMRLREARLRVESLEKRRLLAGTPISLMEVNYHALSPSDAEAADVAPLDLTGQDFEFIELKNTSTESVDMSGMRLTEGVDYTFPALTLARNEHVLVVKNTAAFETRYGDGHNIAGNYAGNLSNAGETIAMSDASGIEMFRFTFSDKGDWPARADGQGSSLEVIDHRGDLDDPAAWRASIEYHGSPGVDGTAATRGVVINEVLSHTDAPNVDTVELYNTTNEIIDLSGWYLSDTGTDLTKYQVPVGTTIAGRSYVTFDENDFNSTMGVADDDFAIDGAHGDELWLTEGDGAGNVLRFADVIEIDAQANGESWGRLPVTATEYVIHISVDALRGDRLETLVTESPRTFRSFTRLQTEGAYTYNARTDLDYTETVPNHISMVTGRPVEQPAGQANTTHHGYNINFPGPAHTIHENGNPNVAYVSSTFDVVHDHGLSTALYTSKTRLGIIEHSYAESAGAPDTIGEDDGTSKIDYSMLVNGGSSGIVNSLIANMESSPHNYSFLHLVEPDTVGHAVGWEDAAWTAAVRTIDGFLGRIMRVIDTNPQLTGRTTIILTGDHGGGVNIHRDPTAFVNYNVPLFVWGAGLPANTDLHELASNRFDVGVARPSYDAGEQPWRNGDTGNLAMMALGLPSIPGSLMQATMIGANEAPALYPLESVTLGFENSGPRTGPLLISEVHFNPSEANERDDDREFIEIYNPTDAPVDLADWRLSGGVNYEFEDVTLEPQEALVVVAFSPDNAANNVRLAEFRSAFDIDESVRLVGGFAGKLANGGEEVRLERADERPIEEPDFIPRILEDQIIYGDDPPWPLVADGQGASLNRRADADLGTEATSWHAGSPTPGSFRPSTYVSHVSVGSAGVDPPDIAGAGIQPTSLHNQRSEIREIEIHFSQDIVLSRTTDLTLTNMGIDAPADPDVAVQLSSGNIAVDGNIIRLRFSEDEFSEGVYQLRLAGEISDTDGNLLDGNGDGVGGDSFVLTGDRDNGLFRLQADWNGDGGISIFDIPTLAYWFGHSGPDYVDLNNDGSISIFDLPLLVANFGRGLTFPSPAGFVDEVSMRSPRESAVHQARAKMEQPSALDEQTLNRNFAAPITAVQLRKHESESASRRARKPLQAADQDHDTWELEALLRDVATAWRAQYKA